MDPLTVTSYNVRHATLDEEPHTWERRRAGVVDRVRAADPDVIALQESTGEQHVEIAEALPAYDWVGVADEPGSGEHNPIGYGPRVPLVGSETTWLSESGEPGSVGWDAVHARALTRADLVDRETDGEFTVFNTHFDHVGTRARYESVALLRERIDGLAADRPVVVVGDFNAEPGRDAYERLLDGEFRHALADARLVADAVDGPETTLSDFDDLRPGRRVDHALVTPAFAVERFSIDATRVDGRYPSDHLPVTVELSRSEDGPSS